MREFIIAAILFVSAISLQAQEAKARLVDEFSILACGDIMGRLDVLLSEWRNNKDEQIIILFYGQRYRKPVERKKDGSEIVRLTHAHPEDGLNWARGIPKYLLARYEDAWSEDVSILKRRIKLIDGGYRERILAEIWLVPSGVTDPVPTPSIAKADIKFGAKQPRRVPDYYNCYSAY